MTVHIIYPDGQFATQDIEAEATAAVGIDPYALGGKAWFNNLPESACPYPIPGARAERWLAGWRESARTFDEAPATEPEIVLGEPVA